MAPGGPLATGMMDHEGHQGLHSETLVRSIVAAAGLELSRPEPAYGKDFYIGFPGPMATIKSPWILASVKSWRNATLNADGSWHYGLKNKNYDFLAKSTDLRPYLFLAVVPEERDQYSSATHDGLLLRNAIYWLSFETILPTGSPHPESTTVVEVPKLNLLTAETLKELVLGNEAAAVVPT